jgi:hypothetical protein
MEKTKGVNLLSSYDREIFSYELALIKEIEQLEDKSLASTKVLLSK